MDCGCEIDGTYDNDPVDVYSERMIRARKHHDCEECDGGIKPGDEYESAKWMAEGEWSSAKTCTNCLSVRRALFCSYGTGQLWEDVRVYVANKCGGLPWSLLEKLTPAAKARVIGIVDEYIWT